MIAGRYRCVGNDGQPPIDLPFGSFLLNFPGWNQQGGGEEGRLSVRALSELMLVGTSKSDTARPWHACCRRRGKRRGGLEVTVPRPGSAAILNCPRAGCPVHLITLGRRRGRRKRHASHDASHHRPMLHRSTTNLKKGRGLMDGGGRGVCVGHRGRRAAAKSTGPICRIDPGLCGAARPE